jgi:hypothetical protein
MIPWLAELNLRSAEPVIELLDRGAAANANNRFRTGCIERIPAPPPDWTLIATGDLHDNPQHLARVVTAAGMGDPAQPPTAHLTLHEIIHGDHLVNDLDLSYRALARVAALKAQYPEHVHTLLANHELAQVSGAGITKGGVPVVKAFNDGVEYVFGSDAPAVLAAVGRFIRSMPLALRLDPPAEQAACGDGAEGGAGGGAVGGAAQSILCAHSLPAPDLMDRFDPSILDRDYAEHDFVPRRGSAHLMIWGRGHTPEQLHALGEAWNVGLFILGHEKAPDGWFTVGPRAVVLNSDHERGVFARLTANPWPTQASLPAAIVALQ